MVSQLGSMETNSEIGRGTFGPKSKNQKNKQRWQTMYKNRKSKESPKNMDTMQYSLEFCKY